MYNKNVIVKLIKKARELKKEKQLSARAIAKKMKVSKDSVNKWLKMKFEDENQIAKEYKEKRWFKKWVYRKYSKVIEDRVKAIYNEMVEEKKFFINEHTILNNYKELYQNDDKEKLPNIYYIQFLQKKNWLHKKHQKPFRNWLSKYMHYPENTINKLWYFLEWIDFVGPRYLQWDSTPYHFLSRRYIRPDKFWNVDIVWSQTTEETIKKLCSDREHWPVPQVLKIDNDSAFWMLKSWKTKNCIWSFTKRLLSLWVKPIYSVPREPRNNWNVEWQNSIFNQLFRQEILFDSPAHLRTEITRFNTEYQQYSDLVQTKKDDIEKLKIEEVYIDNICEKKWISKEKIISKEYYEGLKKADFLSKKVYILRKVCRVWEKWKSWEYWQIEVLWDKIEIERSHINSIVICELDVEFDILKVSIEIDWNLNTLKEKKFVVKNI